MRILDEYFVCQLSERECQLIQLALHRMCNLSLENEEEVADLVEHFEKRGM